MPYLSEDELCSLRDARIRSTVRYAARTVPYWRDLFKREDIDPREISSARDLDRLPLITKEKVRADPGSFVSTSRRGKNSILFSTSGSTGAPLEIYYDRRSLLANIAYGEREREILTGILGKGFKYREAVITYPESTINKVQALYREMVFIPVRPDRLRLTVFDPVEKVLDTLNDFKPHLLLGYGSYLELLFKEVLSRGLKLHLPKLIVFGADAMSNETRDLIEGECGVPVLSNYTAVESFKIGFLCEERTGFHIHEDLCHVKIINDSGKRAMDGEKGVVVISNLVNRGTVLLNYVLGDVASIDRAPCPCGRTFARLKGLEGRSEDIIHLPDGRFVQPRAIWSVFKGKREVLQYQLIQHQPNRFELKLVTADKDGYDRLIDDALSGLRGFLGDTVKIEATYHSEIKRPKGGKFRPVVSFEKR